MHLNHMVVELAGTSKTYLLRSGRRIVSINGCLRSDHETVPDRREYGRDLGHCSLTIISMFFGCEELKLFDTGLCHGRLLAKV